MQSFSKPFKICQNFQIIKNSNFQNWEIWQTFSKNLEKFSFEKFYILSKISNIKELEGLKVLSKTWNF